MNTLSKINLFSLSLFLGFSSIAAPQSVTPPVPPEYSEYGNSKYTPEEVEELVQYLDLMSEQLLELKGEAKNLDPESQMNFISIRLLEIEQISRKTAPTTEVLMRMSIHAGLLMTVGAPSSIEQKVAPYAPENLSFSEIRSLFPTDMKALILMETIDLALHYYQSDYDAVKSGNYRTNEIGSYAFDQLKLFEKHMRYINSPVLRVSYLDAALGYWTIVMKSPLFLENKKFSKAMNLARISRNQIRPIDQQGPYPVKGASVITRTTPGSQFRDLHITLKKILKNSAKILGHTISMNKKASNDEKIRLGQWAIHNGNIGQVIRIYSQGEKEIGRVQVDLSQNNYGQTSPLLEPYPVWPISEVGFQPDSSCVEDKEIEVCTNQTVVHRFGEYTPSTVIRVFDNGQIQVDRGSDHFAIRYPVWPISEILPFIPNKQTH
tara:strand:- start:3067 stop:4368 length:1302 start_codon:yes stop_codon:yes gene_type:complete